MADFYIAVLLSLPLNGQDASQWMENRYLAFPTRGECVQVLGEIEGTLRRWVEEQMEGRKHTLIKFDCLTLEEKMERNDALEGI